MARFRRPWPTTPGSLRIFRKSSWQLIRLCPTSNNSRTKGEWHVLIDEALQVVRYQQHRVPQTHNLITDHLDVIQVNAIYGRITVSGYCPA